MEKTDTRYYRSSIIFWKKALITGAKVNEITNLFILFHLVRNLPKKISLQFSRRFKKNSFLENLLKKSCKDKLQNAKLIYKLTNHLSDNCFFNLF